MIASFSTREKHNRVKEENRESKASVLLVRLKNIPMKKRDSEIQKGRIVLALIKKAGI